MKSLSCIVVIFLLITSCGFNKTTNQTSSNTAEPQEVSANQGSHKVTVTELIQSSNYSYLKLKEGDQEYWAAVTRFEAKVGQTYYYTQGMEMKDFKSRELNRTFDSIWFIGELSEQPISAKKPQTLTTSGRQTVNQTKDISVKAAEGGTTISALMSNKSQFANKTIKINGQVVKFSADIMSKNWVHLQDGTESSGQYDLVITTNDVVRVGDIVTFEGRISLDKDFGYGYKYDILMEDAKALTAKGYL